METSRSPRSRRAGRVLVRVVFLACRQLPSSYVLTWPLLCACKESILVSLLIRTPRVRCQVRGPTLITSLNFNYLLEGSVEKEMATHSSILAWRILWMEEPGGLLSIGLHRVRHDWSDLACTHALEKEMAAHSSVLAWIILWTEEFGGLLSMGLHRVGQDWSNSAAAVVRSLSPNSHIGSWVST